MEMKDVWDKEDLFFEGDAYFEDLLNGLRRAQKTICLETYIFQSDAVGMAIEEELAAAAARGVKVRLLVDGIGAAQWVDRQSQGLQSQGVEVRVYHPVALSVLFSRLMMDLGLKRSTVRKGSAVLFRLNRRTHRKMCIIDGETAWVGSLNIAADHCFSHSGHGAWRDTAVRVRGGDVGYLITAFDYVWIRSHIAKGKRRWRESILPKIKRPGTLALVRLNYTRRLRKQSFNDLSKRIRSANERLWITNAYLAPSTPLLRLISKAAERGVDVRILVPRKSDVFFMPWVASAHYAQLLRAGVRVFEYLPRFLHAKSLIIDNWALIGTSNLNRRSFLHDFEVDIVVTKEDSIQKIERQFCLDLESSEEITVASTGLSIWVGRLVAFLFKRWI